MNYHITFTANRIAVQSGLGLSFPGCVVDMYDAALETAIASKSLLEAPLTSQ
jgi:hypothetical protein